MFKIKADRPALEIDRGGVVSRWEYDVVALRLEIERLQKMHKVDREPNQAFLEDFRSVLIAAGLEGCTLDLALRMFALVNVQFTQLSYSIFDQVKGV